MSYVDIPTRVDGQDLASAADFNQLMENLRVIMGKRYTSGSFTSIVGGLSLSPFYTYRVVFSTGCTGLPNTAREWVVDLSVISSTNYIMARARNDQTLDTWYQIKAAGTWGGEWLLQTDSYGRPYGCSSPIDCGSNSFKDIVLANPGATRFKVNPTTADSPVAGANFSVDVVWFNAAANVSSSYFKAIARNVPSTNSFVEYEINYSAGAWGTWELTRDAYGYKSMGYDDIGSGKTFSDLLALMPAAGIAARWFNLLTTSAASPDTSLNWRTLAIGSQGGCILHAYGSGSNYSEYANRYSGTWSGWVRTRDKFGSAVSIGDIDSDRTIKIKSGTFTGNGAAMTITFAAAFTNQCIGFFYKATGNNVFKSDATVNGAASALTGTTTNAATYQWFAIGY